jgi:hypothetical protein
MNSDEDDTLAVLDVGPPPEGYLRTDEIADVVAALDLLGAVSPLLLRHPPLWKWLIIAAHNALQGAMVCALSGTAGVGALDNRSRNAVLERLEKDDGP